MRAENMPIAATLDSMNSACGDLLNSVFERLKPLTPGQVLEVITDDAGAPVELAAWCRVTGHTLLQTIQTPGQRRRFLIQKKGT